MADLDIYCNVVTCHKVLTNKAYITTCSHAFCEEHGTSLSSEFQCPACSTTLQLKLDVVQTNLQPTELFKTMVLAGLKPDVIADISRRATSFWMFQISQEYQRKEHENDHFRTKIGSLQDAVESHNQMRKSFESEKKQLKRQNNELKIKISAMAGQIENLKMCAENEKRKRVLASQKSLSQGNNARNENINTVGPIGLDPDFGRQYRRRSDIDIMNTFQLHFQPNPNNNKTMFEF